MTDRSPLDGRFTAETLGYYFEAESPATVKLTDSPRILLILDPVEKEMQLWLPADDSRPEAPGLAQLSIDEEVMDTGTWCCVTVNARDARFEAYSILAAIVDDVVGGATNARAISQSLESFRDLLSRRSHMSRETVIGLFGELLFLESLIGVIGAPAALDAWLGPAAEEHDFVLPDFDVEVKTTLSERRQHHITNETQLMPTSSRPLWFLSVQITRGGDTAGERLGELIARLERSVGDEVRAFRLHLAQVGWHESDAHLYRDRFMLRTPPHPHPVDSEFPAITRPLIDKHVQRPDLVGPVSYVIDVTSLDPGTPPALLTPFVGAPHI